jgi:hypothetical protein
LRQGDLRRAVTTRGRRSLRETHQRVARVAHPRVVRSRWEGRSQTLVGSHGNGFRRHLAEAHPFLYFRRRSPSGAGIAGARLGGLGASQGGGEDHTDGTRDEEAGTHYYSGGRQRRKMLGCRCHTVLVKLRQYIEAVVAGTVMPYSQGQTERWENKLKLIKPHIPHPLLRS